jgi:hypothetical protein
MQMHTYFVLLTLFTFSSAGFQKVLNVSKCIADIQQELSKSSVFIMQTDGEKQGEIRFEFSLHECSVFGKKITQTLSHQTLQNELKIPFWKR